MYRMPRSWLAAPLVALSAFATLAAADTPGDPIERAFSRLYNFDFSGAHAILEACIADNTADPLPYAVRAAVHLFYELDRLAILEGEFFADDKRLTEKKRMKPDPEIRRRFFQSIEQAQSRARVTLATATDDYRGMYAMCMTHGLVMDYTALVEKRHLGSLSLAKQSNACAQRLLKAHPQAYDAYVTTGFTEYLVGSLPFYIRWFVRFDDVKGSKEQGIQNLRLVVQSGHYLKSFAKVLLAIAYLREKQPQETEKLLSELAHDYPQNQLFRKELAKISTRLQSGAATAP